MGRIDVADCKGNQDMPEELKTSKPVR